MPDLSLKYQFNYTDLFQATMLAKLDALFLAALSHTHPTLRTDLLAYRQSPPTSPEETSTLLMACAKHLESFLIDFFNIAEPFAIAQANFLKLNPIAIFKQHVVLRYAKKQMRQHASFPSFDTLNQWLESELHRFSLPTTDTERATALLSQHYLSDPHTFHAEITQLTQWCVQALSSTEGQQATAHWSSLKLPQPIDPKALVATLSELFDPLKPPSPITSCHSHSSFKRYGAPIATWQQREGFKLTDPRMNAREIQNEIHYCLYCHHHKRDFCSKGFPVDQKDWSKGFRNNALNILLTGCPLEQKISEAHQLQQEAHFLAALAIIMIDNPLCPATGHRICNDCMTACIYQKQEPVNIPQIETAILSAVLKLPWGVELYDLLTRWNPLCQKNGIMQPYNGLKVMIAGMGPAGFTLAHYLLQAGCAVVGFDGLKIEPLPPHLLTQPIYEFSTLYEALDQRLMTGFGGVAEYGITARWDKNFLKMIYLSLMRRPTFQVFGNVRFGGTLMVEDAWEMGFHHFVIAVGAGLPKALNLPGSLAPGMRQANDFLMGLQLGEANKLESITSLQIRLPAIVIGGGLTGVDTATELQAYYITQVEKIAYRYQILIHAYNETIIHSQLDATSLETLIEWLQHAVTIQQERKRAQQQQTAPDFIRLIRSWGGVTIVYRRTMQESPAYIHNHEELEHALKEGIYYMEQLEPLSVELDSTGYVAALLCQHRIHHTSLRLPARSILVATGTRPNIAYEFEHRGTFKRTQLHYQRYERGERNTLIPINSLDHCKSSDFGPFTSYQDHLRRVSLIGDTHPVFHGSVVKAIASAKKTYPKIMALLSHHPIQLDEVKQSTYQTFATCIRKLFNAQVHTITRHSISVLELVIQAPLATRHFQAGQFYRLQNLSTQAQCIEQTRLQMEPIALVASACNTQQGTLTFLVQEQTASAKLCATLKVGEPIALMGPTGVRTKIPDHPETILIIGDASSVAFTLAYGSALRKAGHQVLYLASFPHAKAIYQQDQLEQATDYIIWATPTLPLIQSNRKSDLTLSGSSLLKLFAQIQHSKLAKYMQQSHRIILMGSIDLLRDFQTTQDQLLKEYFFRLPQVMASVLGNMQCMLKGVCAQCFQWQIDPLTQKRSKAVFACSWQNQPLELIDLDHLHQRQFQNRLHEHINHLWIDYLLEKHPIKTV